MKPVSIIFLIIAVVMVIVGLLTCSVAMLQSKSQGVELYDTKIENGKSEAEYDFSNDVIGKIQIEVNDCDVNIICGADDNKVVMNNFSSAGYICEVDNRALVIEDTVNLFDITDIIENGKIRFKGFRYYLHDRNITPGGKSLNVYISDKFDIKIIDVTVKSGDVNIKGYTNNTDYIVTVNRGNITAENIITDSLVKASTDKGTVTMDRVTSKTVSITVSEGDISAILSADEITAETKKGSVSIESEKDLSGYNYFLSAPNSVITLEKPLKTKRYITSDAQLTSFIHASSATGSVTVKSYTASFDGTPDDTTGTTDAITEEVSDNTVTQTE